MSSNCQIRTIFFWNLCFSRPREKICFECRCESPLSALHVVLHPRYLPRSFVLFSMMHFMTNMVLFFVVKSLLETYLCWPWQIMLYRDEDRLRLQRVVQTLLICEMSELAWFHLYLYSPCWWVWVIRVCEGGHFLPPWLSLQQRLWFAAGLNLLPFDPQTRN